MNLITDIVILTQQYLILPLHIIIVYHPNWILTPLQSDIVTFWVQ